MKPGVISVIIPCYNVAPYVKRCIDSVLNNTYRNLQVICVNDGSTDDTLEILKSYTDERMIVVSQENKGLALTRNVGMEYADGEFFCFIDSDDWIHKEYFMKLIEVQRKTHADITVCKYLKTHDFCDDSEIKTASISTKRFVDVFNGSVLCDVVWCKLYKSDFIGDTRFVNVFSEDKLFNASLLISQKDAVCAIVDAALYYYFMRADSAIHSYHEHLMLSLAQEFLKLSKKTTDSELFKSFVETSVKIALSSRYMTMFRRDLDSYNKSCDDFLRNILDKLTCLSFLKRCMYYLFVKVPSSYRMFRKLTDPSMSSWEKKEIALQKTA